MELPLSPFSVGCSSLVVTDSQWVTNPSPTSSKTLVNTKFVWTPEIGIETFPRETEIILLEVSLAPCFLWAVSWGAQNGSVNGNTANCFCGSGRVKEWRKGLVLEDLRGPLSVTAWLTTLRGHCQETTEIKGQGSPGEQTEPRKLLGSPCSSSEACENFAYWNLFAEVRGNLQRECDPIKHLHNHPWVLLYMTEAYKSSSGSSLSPPQTSAIRAAEMGHYSFIGSCEKTGLAAITML